MADQTVTDPLGRAITLHDRTWFGHILRGHPELAAHRELVLEAVRRPGRVCASRSGRSVRLYVGAGPRPTVTMVVAADIELGLVKTAYLARPGKVNGANEWP